MLAHLTGTGFVMWCPMFALLLVAASLGLSNFAAAIAIGVSGVAARTRLRVGIVFGLFEAGMYCCCATAWQARSGMLSGQVRGMAST